MCLDVREVIEGQVLAHPVKKGEVLLLPKGVTLTSRHKELLLRHGIYYVFVC